MAQALSIIEQQQQKLFCKLTFTNAFGLLEAPDNWQVAQSKWASLKGTTNKQWLGTFSNRHHSGQLLIIH